MVCTVSLICGKKTRLDSLFHVRFQKKKVGTLGLSRLKMATFMKRLVTLLPTTFHHLIVGAHSLVIISLKLIKQENLKL